MGNFPQACAQTISDHNSENDTNRDGIDSYHKNTVFGTVQNAAVALI